MQRQATLPPPKKKNATLTLMLYVIENHLSYWVSKQKTTRPQATERFE